MIKKIPFFTFLIFISAFSVSANIIQKKVNPIEQRNAKISKSIADPIKTKHRLHNATLNKLATQFMQVELIDTWNRTTQDWDSSNRNTYVYDASNNLLKESIRNVVSGEGIQYEYIYDNGKIVEDILRYYDTTNHVWKDWFHNLYTYDNSGRLNQRLYQEWDPVNQIWLNRERETLNFNSNNFLSLYLMEIHTGIDWKGIEGIRLEYVLDANNRNIEDMAIYLDTADQTWDTVDRMLHVYSTSGIQTINTYQLYVNGTWVNFMKEEIELDITETATSHTLFMYNEGASKWDSTERTINMQWFDWTGRIADSDPSYFIYQLWDVDSFKTDYRYTATKPDPYGSEIENRHSLINNQWIPNMRITTIVDEYMNLTNFMFEYFIDTGLVLLSQNTSENTYQNGMLKEMIYRELDGSTGILEKTARFRYSELTAVGINDNKLKYASLNAYPNPITNGKSLSIQVDQASIASIEIYNLSGNLVSEVCKNEKINKGIYSFKIDLPSGMYFVKTKLNGKLFNNKIVVE